MILIIIVDKIHLCYRIDTVIHCISKGNNSFYTIVTKGTEKMLAKNSKGLLNDLSNALGQQLFFWGRDVMYSEGNLLCEFGLERYKPNGITGSSCYRTIYKNDIIELHSLCVGRYSQSKPSLFYTRQYRKLWVYEDKKPPIPGHYDEELLNKKALDQIEIASRSFLEWWLEYESWIDSTIGQDYRYKCYRAYRNLSKSKSWLQPREALSWLTNYMESPTTVPRAKNWNRKSKSRTKNSFSKNVPYYF